MLPFMFLLMKARSTLIHQKTISNFKLGWKPVPETVRQPFLSLISIHFGCGAHIAAEVFC